MNLATKLLIAALILSGLMPLAACYFAVFNQEKIIEMAHLTSASTPDLEKTIGMLGSALVIAAIIQFVAASWIWKRKEAGFMLSFWVGIMLIAVAVYLFIFTSVHNISDSFYLVDLVKGIVILALTYLAMKKPTKA